jgi:hypothetical protein
MKRRTLVMAASVARAQGSGTLEISWEGDRGFRHRQQRQMSIT